SGEYEGLLEFATSGRRPNGGYIPRFRNLHKQETNFLRGYAAGFSGSRAIETDRSGIGAELERQLLNPNYGSWRVGSHRMGETIPKEERQVSLDKSQTDERGIPLLKVSVDYDQKDEHMIKDYIAQMSEMFQAAGCKNIR